jgi:D-2-hydroxyacid dehydrogenase (NADP+)
VEPKTGPIKVLISQALAPNLLDDIRNIDARLEVDVIDREMVPLFFGRAPADGETSVQQRFASLMADAEVLYGLILSTEQARGILAKAPKLRWFQSTSAGVDELIDAGFSERGVTVTTSSGVHATPIAEFALHLMLMFAKQAARSLRRQQEKRWERFTAAELRDATVGVVGLGHIGSEVARLAKGFGCRVLAVDRREEAGAADKLLPPTELHRLLGESDYVVLAVPLSKETRHMIGEAELRAMKPSAVLINVCRGAVVDEEALVRALKEGWIAGAGLDVFETEPLPPESELWGMENVLISPHITGGTVHYFERAVPIFCENLRRYLDGRPLLNLIVPERGY